MSILFVRSAFLSNEIWPYKQGDLTSGTFYQAPTNTWDPSKPDLTDAAGMTLHPWTLQVVFPRNLPPPNHSVHPCAKGMATGGGGMAREWRTRAEWELLPWAHILKWEREGEDELRLLRHKILSSWEKNLWALCPRLDGGFTDRWV